MIKFVLASLWISAVTVGAVYFAFDRAGPEQHAEPAELSILRGLDYVKTDVISVPIVRDGDVRGYFLARLVYTAPADKLKKMEMPPNAIIADEVYTFLYANPVIDFMQRSAIDLDAFRTGIRDAVNRRMGEQFIHDVIIEQMDFMTREDVRNGRRGADAPRTAAPVASSHH